MDAALGVIAIPGSQSNPSPSGVHILPLIEDGSDDYHSWNAEVAAGTPPQKMKLFLDIARSTTCMSFLLTAAVVVTKIYRVHL